MASPKEVRLSVHFNGSVALAFALGGHRSGRDSHLPNWQFDSAVVEAAVADFMGLVLTMGLHVGSGEYEVRIGIEHGGPEQMIMQTADTHGFAFTDTSIPMHRFTPVEATVTAADDEQYFHQVRALIQDCVNQGGITSLRITDHLPLPGVLGIARRNFLSDNGHPSAARHSASNWRATNPAIPVNCEPSRPRSIRQ
jgi:hypothetical protein